MKTVAPEEQRGRRAEAEQHRRDTFCILLPGSPSFHLFILIKPGVTFHRTDCIPSPLLSLLSPLPLPRSLPPLTPSCLSPARLLLVARRITLHASHTRITPHDGAARCFIMTDEECETYMPPTACLLLQCRLSQPGPFQHSDYASA